jgi:hypothetical protein
LFGSLVIKYLIRRVDMKEKVVYTRWLANELVKAGFPVERIE